jgi:hypothetical protein
MCDGEERRDLRAGISVDEAQYRIGMDGQSTEYGDGVKYWRAVSNHDNA